MGEGAGQAWQVGERAGQAGQVARVGGIYWYQRRTNLGKKNLIVGVFWCCLFVVYNVIYASGKENCHN